MSRRLTALVYAQHLSGVGHYVRSRAIARELARGHDVTLVEGGRPVPRPDAPELTTLTLPGLQREAAGSLAACDGQPLDATLAERRRRLAASVSARPPDVVVIEHFPFSKWELGDEVAALLAAARLVAPHVRVACSIRDVCRPTRHEAGDPLAYRETVLRALASDFDALLVHADPQLTTLDEHVAFAGEMSR